MENKKHGQIMETARQLFWRYGFKRVTVEEICSDAGVSKMTFYKFFPNKIALALEILGRFYESAMAQYRGIMDSDRPFPEKVQQTISMKLENAKGISQELVNELYKSGEPAIMDFVRHWSERSLTVIMQDIRSWQAGGLIRKDLKPEFLMQLMSKITDLTTDEHFTTLYANPAEMVNDLANFFFYGLMPLNTDRR